MPQLRKESGQYSKNWISLNYTLTSLCFISALTRTSSGGFMASNLMPGSCSGPIVSISQLRHVVYTSIWTYSICLLPISCSCDLNARLKWVEWYEIITLESKVKITITSYKYVIELFRINMVSSRQAIVRRSMCHWVANSHCVVELSRVGWCQLVRGLRSLVKSESSRSQNKLVVGPSYWTDSDCPMYSLRLPDSYSSVGC